MAAGDALPFLISVRMILKRSAAGTGGGSPFVVAGHRSHLLIDVHIDGGHSGVGLNLGAHAFQFDGLAWRWRADDGGAKMFFLCFDSALRRTAGSSSSWG